MKCPACSNQLTVKNVAGINLDVCDEGCGGIWFDQFEFKKFDEAKEPDAETLLNLKITKKLSAGNTQYKCPKCLDITMLRHYSSAKKKVTLDECGNCAGIWLDAGELHEIREEFATEADRQKAAEALFSQMFDSQLKEAQDKSKAEAEKVLRFGKSLRFICPSYYIQGK